MRPLAFALALSLASLMGCSLSSTGTSTASSLPEASITGTVYGGQQAVYQAHVYLLAPNFTGSGGNGIAPSSLNASLSLLNSSVLTNNPSRSGVDANGNYYVTTSARGGFNITNDYSCSTGYTQGSATATTLTPSQPVYLYAVGGSPGSTSPTNSYAAFMESLGPCSGLSSSTSVQINEVTTVALAYAAAGFATNATHISSSGTPLALTGIANAFANTTNLVNAGTGFALNTTPGGNGTVPAATLYTLANILATCVNSDPSNSGQCSALSGAATSTGTPSGTSATDTATAAIYIAQNPGANVPTLYDLPNGVNAFGGGLTGSNPPNDFTLPIAFSGSSVGMVAPASSQTSPGCHSIGIDAGGNAWVVNGKTASLFQFNPLGVPTAFSSTQIVNPNVVAVAPDSANVMVLNSSGSPSVADFQVSNSSSTALNNTNNPIQGPLDMQFDGRGDLWLVSPNGNGGTVVVFNPANSVLGGITTGLNQPTSLGAAAGVAGNIWLGNSANSADLYSSATIGQKVSTATAGSIAFPDCVAFDSAGSAWLANTNLGAASVSTLAASGSTGSSFSLSGAAGDYVPALAVDGGGNVWVIVSSPTTNSLFELNNSGTNLSGTNGYAYSSATQPARSVAIDGSGDVWYQSSISQGTGSGSSFLYELIGAAVPVVTPLAYGTVNSMLGARP